MNSHSPRFVLNFATGSVSFGLSPAGGQALKTALAELTERLRLTATQKQPQASVDFQQKEDGLTLEVFCNPNIWPSPHAAKVLVTLKSPQVRVSTEADLSRVMEDLSQYLEAC